MRKMLIIEMGILFLCTGVLSATIINIPNDYPTIQQGINASQDADTVLAQPGTYIENINFNGKNITVASLFLTTADTSYISQTIIDGNQNGSVVTFESGEDSTAMLSGFIITNGLAAYWPGGGGIHCFESSPSLENVMVSGNTANDTGGGIYCWGSNISLENSTVNENMVTGDIGSKQGGGIQCSYSTLNLVNVKILNNSVSGPMFALGGGIQCSYSTLSLVNVKILDNSTTWSGGSGGGGIYCSSSSGSLVDVMINGNATRGHGGGIYISNSSNLSLVNVTISGNTANYWGGGIYCYLCSPSLENVTVIGNISYDDGGGGISCHFSSLSLANVTILDNSSIYGGGIYCHSSNPKLVNVTISGNDSGYGGGIYCQFNSCPSLVNSILWNNLPQEVYFRGDFQPSFITLAYSDIQNGEEGIVTNNNGTVNWLVGNIDEDPLFVDTLNGDYHLMVCSPCIDVGTAFFVWEGDTLVNIPDSAYYGSAPDMGAYEWWKVSIDDIIYNYDTIILHQNFPNPFSTSTKISFSLPHPDNIKIQIYNLKGQLVETLLNENKPAGSHTLEWNAEKASSGIYFMKLSTKEVSKIQKVILIQ